MINKISNKKRRFPMMAVMVFMTVFSLLGYGAVYSQNSEEKVPLSGNEYLKTFDINNIKSDFDNFYRDGLSLDGDWTVLAYYDGEGQRRVGYKRDNKKDYKYIKVPGHWILQGYLDVSGMELEKTFKIGEKKHGERMILHFGGSIYFTSIKLNGSPLKTTRGEEIHEGYFTSFEYDITDNLKYNNDNIIEVKVLCPNEKPDTAPSTQEGGTGFPHWGANKRNVLGVLGFHDTKPGNAGHQKFNVGGIWLPIRIFTVNDEVRLFDKSMVNTTLLPVKGNIPFERRDSQININMSIENTTTKEITADITIEGKPYNFKGKDGDAFKWVQEVALPKGRNEVELAGIIKDAKLWYPWFMGKPNLYRLNIVVKEKGSNKLLCRDTIKTGVREMAGKVRGEWKLNGRTLRILGDNVIPSLTPGTYTFQDAIRDCKLIISANIQLVRIHAHISHPYFLEMCDEMGILVWQDFPQQWVSLWNEEYRSAVLSQMKDFARLTVSHPSVVLLNIHNENKYFDSINYYGLPSLKRGIWMNASKPSEEIDEESVKTVDMFFKEHFAMGLKVQPKVGILLSQETGAEYHPYYGYYYGEGYLDFYFLPSPDSKDVYEKYDVFSPDWGWREDAHAEKGVGAVPTSSYERLAGGGGFDRFGPDEFGFQGFSRSAVRWAVREVLLEENTSLEGKELNQAINKAQREIPWGYLYQPWKLPPEDQQNPQDKLYAKVVNKLVEHNLQTFAFPCWVKPEKPLEKITLNDIIQASQNYQAWGTQMTAEVYRRAGYGQTRFMFFSSEDDNGIFYSLDWSVIESDRSPKKAFYSLQTAYQPLLASAEIYSNRIIPGELWLKGIWIINDTRRSFPDSTLEILIKSKGKDPILKETLDINITPWNINDISSLLNGSFVVEDKTLPGDYYVMLNIYNSGGEIISTNIYEIKVLPVKFLSPLKEPQKEKVKQILKKRWNELDKYLTGDLKVDPSQMQTWDDVITQLRKSWTDNWNEKKKDIENNPEEILDFPEFTNKIYPLLNARLKNSPDYDKILRSTRETLKLNERDLKIIMGEKGARVPIPFFYGKEITTDEWFQSLMADLEKEGAHQTARQIRLYYNNRSAHWFDRQLRIYKALKQALE